MNKENLSKLFSLTIAAMLFISCGGNKENNTETEETVAPERNRVRVEQVQIRPVEQLQSFTATVEAETVNNIAPGIPARIRRILVDVGQTVRRGQPLVEMDRTNLAQQQVQIETLRRDYARFQELLAIGGISQQQVDQMKAQLDVAEAQYNNLSENTTLVSPINGVITARNYDSGDMPAGIPILTVQNISPVKILINVPESNFTRIQRGMSVDVRLDVFGDETFSGKVSLIHPTIDPLTRTFRTEITLPNADLRVRPGMFARVTINFGDVERVVVPDKSVVRQQGTGDRYVYTLNRDNTVSYKKVELGARFGNEFEVISGIEPGERVVTEGLSGLVEGTSVEVVN
jgi:RND family efflux transporter MFP subunit